MADSLTAFLFKVDMEGLATGLSDYYSSAAHAELEKIDPDMAKRFLTASQALSPIESDLSQLEDLGIYTIS